MSTSLPLDEELAKAVTHSATQVFEKALNLTVTAQDWSLIEAPLRGDYSGFVYLVDLKEKKHVATMGVAFMDPVIRHILKAMYGDILNQPGSDATDMLKDGISEIANIIYTGVKAKLNEQGHSFILSLPVIIEGKEHIIRKSSGSKSLRIPFVTSDYEFFIDASIDVEKDEVSPERWKEMMRQNLN
jgi:CheY-specific phosphatase CheX